MLKLKYWLVALALCTTAAACSSDDKKSTAAVGEAPAVGEKVTTSITAADGGDVKLGAAKLSIPAGALGADTDITLETLKPSADLPEVGSVKGPVYSFGPDGTTFAKAADLALPLTATPAEGETAVVSWLDTTSNTWQDLKTTVSGTTVTASVSHFTFFVIRFKGVTGPIDCGFTACGGDIVGTWNIDAGCIDDGGSGDKLEGCPTATLDLQTEVTGSVEFKADNTFNVALNVDGSIVAKIPTSCLMGGTCTQLGESLDGTCTTGSGGCDCSAPIDPQTSTDAGTYSISGNTFTTMTDDTKSDSDTNEYCVTGDTLKVKLVDGDDGKVTILVGSRK